MTSPGRARLALPLALSAAACAPAAPAGDAARPPAEAPYANPIPKDAYYTPSTEFSLHYNPVAFGAAATQAARFDKVEFFVTRDMGATWTLYGEDADAVSPMKITVDGEGVYGFYSVATPRGGRRQLPPRPGMRPEFVVVVDRTPPMARWIAPTGPSLSNPESVTFEWESSDDHYVDGPVAIEVSGDMERTWSVVGAELPAEQRAAGLAARGQYSWKPVGRLGSPLRFRLVCRDRAGNIMILRSRTEVRVDNIPPTARVLGPSLATSLAVPVRVEAADGGGSGVADVVLYATYNNGLGWTLSAAAAKPDEPIAFTADAAGVAEAGGKVGLMAVARDGQGNLSPRPFEGMTPPFVLRIDTTPPVVRLDERFIPANGVIRAGEHRTVAWTAEDDQELALNSAVVEYSEDGGRTWARGSKGELGASAGAHAFLAPSPAKAIEQFQIRVSVRDLVGNVGSATSRPFRVEVADVTVVRVEALPSETPAAMEVPVPPIPVGTGMDDHGLYVVRRPSENAVIAPGPRREDIQEPPVPPIGTTLDYAIVNSVPPGIDGTTLPPITPAPYANLAWDPPPFGGVTETPGPVVPLPDARVPSEYEPPPINPAAAGDSRLDELLGMAVDPGQADAALREVQGRLDRGESSVRLHVIAGYANLTLSHLDGSARAAAVHATQACRIDPNNPSALFLSAEVLLLTGKQFYDYLQADRDWELSPEVYADLAAKRDQHLELADKYIARLVNEFPAHPSRKAFLGMYGDVLAYQGRSAQQHAFRRRVYELSAADRARLLAARGNLNAAETNDPASYRRYTEYTDESKNAALALYGHAAEQLQRALELPPANDYDNALALGSLYFRPEGFFDLAQGEHYLLMALRAQDGAPHVEAYNELGECYLLHGRYDQAREYFQTARGLYPANSPAVAAIDRRLQFIAGLE